MATLSFDPEVVVPDDDGSEKEKRLLIGLWGMYVDQWFLEALESGEYSFEETP